MHLICYLPYIHSVKMSTSFECLVDHTSYIVCYKIADAYGFILKKLSGNFCYFVGLVAIARRLQTKPLESPETARCPQFVPELNLSASSWSEDRELEEECEGKRSSPTYAEVASKAPTAPSATAPAAPAEEGEELVYTPQPTPTPWSCYFCHCSNHSLRELCIMYLQSRASTEGVPHVHLICYLPYIHSVKMSTSFECLVNHNSYIVCYKIADAYGLILKKLSGNFCYFVTY